MAEIYFHREDVELPITLNESKIRNWLSCLAQSEGHQITSLNYIFCSDDYLLEVNKQYLNHDYYTDIITFDYTEENQISGDIYISLDRITENSSQFQVTFEEELMRVIAHGCLHLMGYQDKTDEQQFLMTKKEEASLSLLQNIDVPRGTSKKRS